MAQNITYIQPVRLRLNHDILSAINMVQNDTAREFHFYFDDEYTIPTDAETRVYVQKPSGLEVYNSCNIQNNEIVVQPTAQMVAEAGEAIGQIQIIKDSKVISSFPFRLNIAENIVLNITSSSEYEILDALITDARKLVPEMKELIETVITQESQRVNAEKSRVTAESGRVSAEAKRVSAESARATAETGRINAEKNRDSQENARVEAENLRVSNENSRKSAENTRIENENERIEAEKARKSAETGRVNAEKARDSQETSRTTAESKRVTAETGRVNAEKARVTAENKRQENAQTVLDKANTAATTAETLISEVTVSLEALREAAGILSDFGTITIEEINSLKTL